MNLMYFTFRSVEASRVLVNVYERDNDFPVTLVHIAFIPYICINILSFLSNRVIFYIHDAKMLMNIETYPDDQLLCFCLCLQEAK